MYSENQKRFLNFLLNYKKNEINLSFSEVFYEYILQFYRGFIVEIDDDNINFYKIKNFEESLDSEKIKLFQEEIVSILYLIYELYNKKYVIFYGNPKNIKNIYLELIEENNFLFEMKLDFFNEIKNNFFKNYLISPELKEIKSRNFNNIEHQNLKYTLIALWASVILSIVGFLVNILIATKITTVIKFEDPKQLQHASSTTIINMKKWKARLISSFFIL